MNLTQLSVRLKAFVTDVTDFPVIPTAATLWQRFQQDRLGVTASALTFTTVLALVPFFAVVLAVFTAFPLFARFRDALEGWLTDSLIPASIAGNVMDYLTQFATQASQLGTVGFAALVFNLGKADSPPQHLPAHYRHVDRCLPRIEAICARFELAPELRELALLVAMELERVHRAAPMRAASITALLERVDAFARPGRYLDLLTVCSCDYAAYQGNEDKAYPKAKLLELAREACLKTDREMDGDEVADDPARRHELRALAVASALSSQRWSEEGVV